MSAVVAASLAWIAASARKSSIVFILAMLCLLPFPVPKLTHRRGLNRPCCQPRPPAAARKSTPKQLFLGTGPLLLGREHGRVCPGGPDHLHSYQQVECAPIHGQQLRALPLRACAYSTAESRRKMAKSSGQD